MILPEILDFYKEVGSRIKTERIKRNISQESLSNYLGLTRASVINLEKGRHRPSVYQILQVSIFFKMDYTLLIPFEIFGRKAKNKNLGKDLSKIVADQKITDNKAAKEAINGFLSAIKNNDE